MHYCPVSSVPGTVIISHWGVGVTDQLDNLDQCQDDSAGVRSCKQLNVMKSLPHSTLRLSLASLNCHAGIPCSHVVMQTGQISRANSRFKIFLIVFLPSAQGFLSWWFPPKQKFNATLNRVVCIVNCVLHIWFSYDH